jgi:hypothetical protein
VHVSDVGWERSRTGAFVKRYPRRTVHARCAAGGATSEYYQR